MNLTNVLRAECVQAKAQCQTLPEVLGAIAKLSKQSSVLASTDEAVILKGLTDREELSSTGFGNEIFSSQRRFRPYMVCILADIEWKALYYASNLALPSFAHFNRLSSVLAAQVDQLATISGYN
jgi:hypothetical protein